MDQTGVLLVLGGSENTYEVKGANKFLFTGKKKKSVQLFYIWVLVVGF